MISLVEEERQCFISAKGTELKSTPRDISFCGHALMGSGTFVVEDATLDPRFKDNPLVTGEQKVRFYAGALLTSHDGHNLGTLCVIDHVPRTLWESQQKGLEILARQVVTHLELKRSLVERAVKLRQLKDSERARKEKDDLFYSAIESMHDGFVLQDEVGQIIECNARASEILGLTEDELKGRCSIDPRWHCVDEFERPFPGENHPSMVALRTGQKQLEVMMGVHRKDGSIVRIKINAVPLFRRRSPKAYGVLCTFADITEQYLRELKRDQNLSKLKELTNTLEVQRDQLSMANVHLHKLADCDGLTGLQNHRSLHRILDQTFTQTQQAAMLLIDVDHFKKYNDSFGHPAGDALLQQLAMLMTAVVRPIDSVCRYGGEEFAVVLPGANLETAESVAKRLLQRVRDERWPEAQITVSIGIATQTSEFCKDELIEAADKALYQAKRGGRDQYRTAGEPQFRKCS